LRRRLETLAELEFLVELPDDRSTAEEVRAQADKFINQLRSKGSSQLPIKIYFAHSHRFGYELAKTTGSEAHWSALGKPVPFDVWNEEAFYSAMGLPLIPPEARETGEEVALAKGGMLEKLLPWDGIQGVFHAHTQRSDGAASLEQMVRAAKELGYRYIGISDHSQSAFYAQGLKVPELLEQERELRKVQEKYPEIRIFWGIESDILADGSLDYDAKVLKRFDFVIASVHSRFKMDKLAMTQRIVAAIQNPYTRFLGHMTGRLLLGRPAYDLDVERVICEAAQHEVAIEINAHPARLDIDWRWGRCLRDTGTLVSINPDAHDARGLRDTVLGIGVARKALLPADLVLNSRSVTEVERWLRRA
jgi:DNA polymerase (family X)